MILVRAKPVQTTLFEKINKTTFDWKGILPLKYSSEANH
jgi:hypothetical protein